jgi:membrane fusion protein (multidrug efflux system)
MVELPRKEVFEAAGEPEVARVTEAPAAPAADVAPAVEAKGKKSRKLVKRTIMAAALLAGVAFVADYGHHYWTVGRFIESTDDAYVKADYTTVAPKVSGYVAAVLVGDNDAVKAGQVLAKIDDRDHQAALSQVKADVKAATAAITNLDAQIELQQSIIGQARATIDASLATLDFARSDAARSQRLITNGAGTQSRAEQSQSLRDQAQAALERDRAALVAAEKKVPVLQTQREQAVAQRERAAAAQHQAELNLS